jgi:hypothetical protein
MERHLIGVAGIPEAEDEYGCMISPLLHRLFEGAGAGSPAGWTRHERSSHFGAGPDDAADMRLAESLTVWREKRRTEAT